ncbi:extracellular solute-binding protein, family 5 [Trichodesmium erythraeum IMS101]|uniref:Extracellular solute-binding protein, family 5 n=1 Tax=Trichodesmium erythraeum (strain IMS101) TaxID=203124 RepID=Q113Z9_TRIEI|nr:ABC transporter substrate-binding protein [Trichodesmium erythraeum GBRTRLIN201]
MSSLNKLIQKFTHHKNWPFRLIILTIASIAIACNNIKTPTTTSETLTAPETDTLVWARYKDSDTLDPHKTTSPLSRQIIDQIYDTLLTFDDQGKIQPNLAKEWSVNDNGQEYTFKLNENIKCHDGKTFNANAVKFTIDRAIDPETENNIKDSWGPIETVEVVDDLTVKVKMTEPFSPFPRFLADPYSSMICPSAIKTYNNKFGIDGVIGTGPFEFVEWTQGEQLVLKANPNYKNYGRPVENSGTPYIKKLVIKTIPEIEARLAGINSGKIHLTEPPIAEISNLKQDSNLKLYTAKNTGQIVFLEFVTSRAPFNKKKARQAIAYGIDVKKATEEILANLAKPAECPIVNVMFPNDGKLCSEFSIKPDPEKAKTLLKELGYSKDKPLEVTLLTWKGGNREKILENFQTQLKVVGIKANLETMDIGSLNARIKQENSQAEGRGVIDMMGWSWYDPDFLYKLWHSPGWMGGYHSDELDKLLTEMRTATNSKEQQEKVVAVQKYLLNNAVMVPLYSPGWMWNYVSSLNVEGFNIGAFNRPLFNDIKLSTTTEKKEGFQSPASSEKEVVEEKINSEKNIKNKDSVSEKEVIEEEVNSEKNIKNKDSVASPENE